MELGGETVLHTRPIEALAGLGLLGPGRLVEHCHSLPPARIGLPGLRAGRLFMESWGTRELPEPGAWTYSFYDSVAPPLFLVREALVHSSAGIVAVADQVIAETLAHTTPAGYAYRNLVRGIALPRRPVRRLKGAYISLLVGGERNYYHAMLMGLARLAAVPDNYLAAASGVLVPKHAAGQREVLALLDLLPSLDVIEVGDETLAVEALILPLSVCGESAYHPCVADFFRRASASVPPAGSARLPRRLYIDRRDATLRPLTNERDLIRALAPLGFVPVQLARLPVADQIRLFRNADIIVAPHGAGLTNLGYARSGTMVVELLMDAYVNWCYRHLAALMQVRYDCVLGRTRQPWPELDNAFHSTPWEVPVGHVVAAVAQALPAAAVAHAA